MPPRLSTTDDSTLGGSLNPAEATMGQNSNGNKRPRDEEDDLDDDDEEEGGKKERIPLVFLTLGRKIEIAFIKDKSRRHITFSKRKAGIMKKVPHDHH
jgi:pheromone receptor transcription factor